MGKQTDREAEHARELSDAFERGREDGYAYGYTQGKGKAFWEVETRAADPFPHDLRDCGCEPCRIIRLVLDRHCARAEVK